MGIAGSAQISPVKDQEMVSLAPALSGDRRHQLVLGLARIDSLTEAQTLGHTEHMGVHCNGRHIEGSTQNDVGGLSPHSWQCFQSFPIVGYFPPVAFQQLSTGS